MAELIARGILIHRAVMESDVDIAASIKKSLKDWRPMKKLG